MPLIKIARRSDLPVEGQAKEFAFDGQVICIANVAGEYFALDNICVHRGGPLGQGVVENGKVVCPWHGWQYDPQTGEVGRDSGVRVAVFPLKLEGDDVMIEANNN